MTKREDKKVTRLKWLRCRTDVELESLVAYTSLAKHRLKSSPWKLPKQFENAEIINKILGKLR